MTHFSQTREYLEQVKDAAKNVEMLMERIDAYEEAELDTTELINELHAAKQEHRQKVIEVSDMIARIPRSRYRWVLMKKYINLMNHREIADRNKTCVQIVSRDHGLALPEMQDVLVEAGIIAPEDAEDIRQILEEEGRLDNPTMQKYLKYREEKMLRAVQAS